MENNNIYDQTNYEEQNIQEPKPSAAKAGWALGLGIAAATVPIAVVDILFAVVGLVLWNLSKQEGYKGGLLTAALVMNIIGMIIAIIFTIQVLTGTHPFL